jgi:hypothetical protein
MTAGLYESALNDPRPFLRANGLRRERIDLERPQIWVVILEN